jgi:hypothetical protein
MSSLAWVEAEIAASELRKHYIEGKKTLFSILLSMHSQYSKVQRGVPAEENYDRLSSRDLVHLTGNNTWLPGLRRCQCKDGGNSVCLFVGRNGECRDWVVVRHAR